MTVENKKTELHRDIFVAASGAIGAIAVFANAGDDHPAPPVTMKASTEKAQQTSDHARDLWLDNTLGLFLIGMTAIAGRRIYKKIQSRFHLG
jgi:hypothetical protein